MRLVLLLLVCCEARRSRRVVGGEPVPIERAPFIGSMEYVQGQMCGVSVLSESWVITAAHCFGRAFRPDLARIRVGSGVRNEGGTTHTIAAIYKYPGFNMSLVDNDVALIKVYPALEYSKRVRPIRPVQVSQRPHPGDNLTVLGWGYTEEKGNASRELRAVSVPVYDHDGCKRVYKRILNVTDQMLCVGFPEGGRDSCVLDSGGPLVGDGHLTGLVSWGWGCARPRHPGVYADLSTPHIASWIQRIIKP